jgi:hypothetical protein
MVISESERMALCDILLDYIKRDDHLQEFHDVTRGTTTTIEQLLARLVSEQPPEEVQRTLRRDWRDDDETDTAPRLR